MILSLAAACVVQAGSFNRRPYRQIFGTYLPTQLPPNRAEDAGVDPVVQAGSSQRRPYRQLFGAFHPTQLPPIRAEDAGVDPVVQAGSSQRRPYRQLFGAFHPTQLPPIRAEDAAVEPVDQAGHEARPPVYQAGFRLQHTGYRPPPTELPVQEYHNQYRGQGLVDYRASTPKDVVPILQYSNDMAFDGSYNYNFESADGISRQESGVMTNQGTDDESPAVRGSYSYTAPDGSLITVNYIADKDGFRAEGAHLPTPPPIPEAIAKSLEYIARVRSSQPAGYEDDGQYQPERYYQARKEAAYAT